MTGEPPVISMMSKSCAIWWDCVRYGGFVCMCVKLKYIFNKYKYIETKRNLQKKRLSQYGDDTATTTQNKCITTGYCKNDIWIFADYYDD